MRPLLSLLAVIVAAAMVGGPADRAEAASPPTLTGPHPATLDPHPEDLPPDAEQPDGKAFVARGGAVSGFTRSVGAVQGTAFVPVLLVDFPGTLAKAHHRPRAYRRMLFQRDHPVGPGSLRDYFNDQSGGLLDVRGAVTPSWLRMPHPMAHYAGSNNGYQETEPNDRTLVEDAVAAADAVMDFCKGDSDDDGYVDTLFVVHAGPGAEETGSGLWSMKWSLPVPYRTDDVCDGRAVKVSDFTLEPEEYRDGRFSHPDAPANMISIGIFAHEFGHALGLPDLYDTDRSSAGGVGPWELMGTGTYGFDGATPWRPSPLSAWSKAQLGWVRPRTVTTTLLDQVLRPLDRARQGAPTDVYRLNPGGAAEASEYFLVERRGRTGWGADLPGKGILIWHIDEGVDDNDQDGRRLVHLVQADGRNELGTSSDFFEPGDTGDIFPGATRKRLWSPASSPSSDLYGGGLSGLTVRIGPRSKGFPLDLLVSPLSTLL